MPLKEWGLGSRQSAPLPPPSRPAQSHKIQSDAYKRPQILTKKKKATNTIN